MENWGTYTHSPKYGIAIAYLKSAIQFWIFITLLCSSLNISLYSQSPISNYYEISGSVDFVITAGTFRDQNSNNNTDASSLRSTAPGDLTIPAGAEIGDVFLYWAGSGGTPDYNVTFDGVNVSASRTFSDNRLLGSLNIEYFGGFRRCDKYCPGTSSRND